MSRRNQNPNRGINICSINICGLSKRTKLVLDKYVDKEKYDVVSIQETGTCNVTDISLSNMNIITDSNEARNRGTALYVKNEHAITKLDEISVNYKNLDSTWGLTVINGNRYIVGNVYAKLDYAECITDIISMLELAHQKNIALRSKGVILTGDLNARHQLWGDTTSNPYGRKLFEEIDPTKFTIMCAETPTFLSTNGSSFIDLVIISNNLVNKVNSIYTDDEVELFSGAPFRGHVPVVTSINCTNNPILPPEEKLCIKNVNWEEWSQDLETTIVENQDYINNSSDPYELIRFTDNMVNTATEKHGRKKIVCSHTKPYWSKTLSELSAKLQNARKKYKGRNTDSNMENLEVCKKEFDEAMKKSCQEYIMKKTSNLNAVQSQQF